MGTVISELLHAGEVEFLGDVMLECLWSDGCGLARRNALLLLARTPHQGNDEKLSGS